MSAGKFEFVDSIPVATRGGKRLDPLLMEFAEELRRNPGQWAIWPREETSPHHLKNIGSRITRGNDQAPKALRDGFEAHFRRGVLYVRAVVS